MLRKVSTPASRARYLRGGLVGGFSAWFVALAHAAAGGGVPAGSALIELVLVSAIAGTAVSAVTVSGRRTRAILVVSELLVCQMLGHLVLTTAGSHHMSSGWLLTTPMIVFHACAAVAAGLLIGAVEYLYVVAISHASWLRLFVDVRRGPEGVAVCRAVDVVVVVALWLLSGLGMRGPPHRRGPLSFAGV